MLFKLGTQKNLRIYILWQPNLYLPITKEPHNENFSLNGNCLQILSRKPECISYTAQNSQHSDKPKKETLDKSFSQSHSLKERLLISDFNVFTKLLANEN